MTTTSPPEPARDNLALPWFRPAIAPSPVDMADLGSPATVATASASAEMVLVFASTTEVLNAEDRLEAGNFNFSLIPVPKEVNPNCGLALSFPEELAPDIERALAEAGLGPLAVYRRQGEEFRPSDADVFSRPSPEPVE